MKKDIELGGVEGVFVAIARETSDVADTIWKVYIINDNDFDIENVMVSSKGYGEKDGVKQETSVLRHMIELIPGQGFAAVETIHPDVFHLNNEYMVTYYVGNQIKDKKFVFVPESIVDENIHYIIQLNLEGVMHS